LHFKEVEMKTQLRFLMPWLLVAAMPLAVGGCGSHEEAASTPAPAVAPAPAPAETTPATTDAGKGDAAATKPKNAISDVTVGHQLAADGSIAPKEKGKDFQPGQIVYIAFKAGDAPAGTVIHIAWVGPNGQDLGGEDKPVAAGQTYMNFAAAKTNGWGLGDYHADLSTGGEKADTAHFSIVNAKKADKPAT
jgi:hypothetical protein